MEVITLDVKTRETGKRANKALRKEDIVPCVLYGHGIEPVHFGVPTLNLRPLIYTHEAHRVALKVEGKEWDCILKNVDFDPVSDSPTHAEGVSHRKAQRGGTRYPSRQPHLCASSRLFVANPMESGQRYFLSFWTARS